MATLSFGLCACGAEAVVDDVKDQVSNVVQADDENVLAVKGGTNSNYPGITYEEAFESFFAYPTWKYFKGTQDGPDDDGDGEPDYTIDDIDVVEFTGNCTYSDVEVKALIQFELDNDAGTFKASYLSFNDVPQSSLMLNALLSTVFETYMENHGMSTETADADENTVTEDAGVEDEEDMVTEDTYIENDEESVDDEYDDALMYAGTYVSEDGTVIYFNAYSSVEDDEIGNVEIYIDGELYESQTVYLCSDRGGWSDWNYDAFYVIHLEYCDEYFGFYEQDGTIWMDYNGEERGYASLEMTEHYES
jgi:hypothetical protein